MTDDVSQPQVETANTGDDGVEHGIVLGMEQPADGEVQRETVTSPAKVMRIGSMIRQLLDEVKSAEFDDASRERLAEIYERSIVELSLIHISEPTRPY